MLKTTISKTTIASTPWTFITPKEISNRLMGIITKTLIISPIENIMTNLSFLVVLRPIAIPTMVENSAMAFIDAPTMSPLRANMAIRAIMDVKKPGIKPKSSMAKAMGMPVKSNFKTGINGKGIFRFEYFNV